MSKITLFFLLVSSFLFAQVRQERVLGGSNVPLSDSTAFKDVTQDKALKANINQYKIFSIERDTVIVDTSLTIQKEYKYNYLRKDIFGLLPFANEGQTYTTLFYGLKKSSAFPEMGFAGKHFNYSSAQDILYYHVPTPLTELYFKTVMEQGQSLDAFITLNTSENFNFSLAYKGLRSVGKFINQLSSTGNFRFTTNYSSPSKRYFLKAHFVAQDILNGENGGIIFKEDFESGDPEFESRARLQVYLENATTLLKGNRYFLNQSYWLGNPTSENKFYLTNQINFEHKFFEFSQPTVSTSITTPQGNVNFNRFGESFVTQNNKTKTRYSKFDTNLGIGYDSKMGDFNAFIQNFNYNYFYNRVIVSESEFIPNAINENITVLGGSYALQKNSFATRVKFFSSLSQQEVSEFSADLNYKFNKLDLSLSLQHISKLPDNLFTLFQSNYATYNWFNQFNNEKINTIEGQIKSPWVDVSLQYKSITDFLYFSDDSTDGNVLSVTPKQYQNTINYLSLQFRKEFTWWKLGLDNTVLYQSVSQPDPVLNLPEVTLRSSLYFSDFYFKKALFLQTGFIVNYFSAYHADNYNPLIASFYTQNQTKIGNFPMIDFFINAKIKQTRIYLKAEHFNSSLTGFNYYSAPDYPYRDFIVRFGLEWNFFQ